jgi:hypothetical protein
MISCQLFSAFSAVFLALSENEEVVKNIHLLALVWAKAQTKLVISFHCTKFQSQYLFACM